MQSSALLLSSTVLQSSVLLRSSTLLQLMGGLLQLKGRLLQSRTVKSKQLHWKSHITMRAHSMRCKRTSSSLASIALPSDCPVTAWLLGEVLLYCLVLPLLLLKRIQKIPGLVLVSLEEAELLYVCITNLVAELVTDGVEPFAAFRSDYMVSNTIVSDSTGCTYPCRDHCLTCFCKCKGGVRCTPDEPQAVHFECWERRVQDPGDPF